MYVLSASLAQQKKFEGNSLLILTLSLLVTFTGVVMCASPSFALWLKAQPVLATIALAITIKVQLMIHVAFKHVKNLGYAFFGVAIFAQTFLLMFKAAVIGVSFILMAIMMALVVTSFLAAMSLTSEKKLTMEKIWLPVLAIVATMALLGLLLVP